MEKYSVLMSVYHKVNPEELTLSVESMVKQTVPPDEFIIIWDGPVDDDIKAVVDKYSNENPGMFTVIPLVENHGLAYALNVGIEASRNEFIARMDADDIALPERCELELKEFEKHPDYSIVGGICRRFIHSPDDATEFVQKRPLTPDDIRKNLRRTNSFAHPLVMYKKSAVLACGGYDPQLKRRQDYDLFSKMFYEGYIGSNIDKVLLLFREDDNFMERNKNKESCEMRIEVQKRLLHRKQCSIWDYLYIWCAMKAAYIMPLGMYTYFYLKIKKSKD